ncbi:nitroreductase family protein [Aromatoleum diolicum]|uniref:Molybdopterin biosynthesis protein MoeY n=1 Tax=Aromatoleum diolicum TaxID=75796 RepID=A0ABX1QFV8_9RHOO|nr:nitroreductase family protein [Aromatoleum diolicum]NMG76291.1 molybdopterin biosynthesis protein MoeY [Aromatoleum diolicum]
MAERETLLRILDLARWAPSGDNTQPWRFEIVAPDHIAIHGYDTRDWCLYDFDGHASHMAHGALLETLRLAATGFGLDASWSVRNAAEDSCPIYDVLLRESSGVSVDPLLSFVEQRVVQRRPMSIKPLTAVQRSALAAAPGPAYDVQFLESSRDRLKVARLLWDNAHIRLTCPEAYAVHREIIEWGARYSKDRIPEGAVGVDPLTARLMKWVMQRWERVAFFNRYLLGTIPPRIQLDFLPALGCAAHVLLRPREAPVGLADYVRAGVAMQRLWLSASAVGLHLQPQMTPVIFRWYARCGRTFSALPEIGRQALVLAGDFESLVGANAGSPFVFFCRVGRSAAPASRSLRKDLGDLLV